MRVRNPAFTADDVAPVYATGATLAAPGINATDNIIPVQVNGTAGYASWGRIMIDRELIDYHGITGNSLLNAVRGMDGSTAVPHVTGTRVGHYQCNLRSQGGVPALAAIPPPDGLRSLNIGVQLQEGWVVGQPGPAAPPGQRPRLLRWNSVAAPNAWANYNAAAININQQLNGISMLSYADGWSVGNRTAATTSGWFFLRWNNPVAGAWARPIMTTAGVTAQNLNSVHMVSATDGWAVGNVLVAPVPATQRWTFLRWNGAAWSRVLVTTPAGSTAVTLNSVNMISATDGWAVGNVLGAWAGAVTQRWAFFRWDGANWIRVAVNTPGVNALTLQEVTCVHANDCWAVGNAGARLHWDGAVWTAVTVPAVAQNLFSVSVIGARQRPQAGWQEDYQ